MLAVSAAELNLLLGSHPFTSRLGLEVVGMGDGECVVQIPYRPENDRPGGVISGQIYMHAADVTFWLAIKTRLGIVDASVTSSMTTAFLSSARAEDLLCRARVLKLGRRLIYGWAECSAAERPVTHHTLTYARIT